MLYSKILKNRLFKGFFIFLFILLSATKLYAQELPKKDQIGISLSPPLAKQSLKGSENFSQKFKIGYSNIDNPKLEFNYFETDSKQEKRSPSTALRDAISINTKVGSSEIELDIQIDTQKLGDKTYFFLVEILIKNSESSESIQSNIGVGIPIMLTVNKTVEGTNPKPDIVIKPNRKFYLSMSNSNVQSQLINQSDKLIEFGGEIMMVDDKNTILYSETIAPISHVLNPKQAYQKFTSLPELPKKGIFPYYGKVDFVILGSINNERHIETQKVSVWILPYQIILSTFGAIFLTLFGLYSILRKYRKRRILIKHT